MFVQMQMKTYYYPEMGYKQRCKKPFSFRVSLSWFALMHAYVTYVMRKDI